MDLYTARNNGAKGRKKAHRHNGNTGSRRAQFKISEVWKMTAVFSKQYVHWKEAHVEELWGPTDEIEVLQDERGCTAYYDFFQTKINAKHRIL